MVDKESPARSVLEEPPQEPAEQASTACNSGSLQYRWTLRNNFIIGGTAYVPRTLV
jgi:hypothetical protein